MQPADVLAVDLGETGILRRIGAPAVFGPRVSFCSGRARDIRKRREQHNKNLQLERLRKQFPKLHSAPDNLLRAFGAISGSSNGAALRRAAQEYQIVHGETSRAGGSTATVLRCRPVPRG